MNESTNHTPGINHSQFYWLIIPVLFFWLLVNYIVGQLDSSPLWRQNQVLGVEEQSVPFSYAAPPITRDSQGLITLWFDDAWSSQYFKAAPVLRRYGLRAAIAVPTGSIGYDAYLNWAQLRALQQDGWEVTNHSISHDCSMQNWTSEQITTELTQSSRVLWSHQLPSDHFVSPCGVDSDTLRAVAKSEFLSFRTVESGDNDLDSLDPYALKVRNVTNQTTRDQLRAWVDAARDPNKWVIIVFHQVGEESSLEGDQERYNISVADLGWLTEYIQSSAIQVVVPSQAINAVTGQIL